jgi:hypothetical protein
MSSTPSRRTFLRDSALLGAAGLALPATGFAI